MPSEIQAFIERRIIDRPGMRQPFVDLYDAYCAAQCDSVKSISRPTFGRYMTTVFPTKEMVGNRIVYLGIELLPANATKIDAMKRKS